MAIFRQSILAVDQAITVDGDVSYDLPVDPLSVVLVHISPLNETSTLTNYRLLVGLLGAVDNLVIAHRGASVIAVNGQDLAMLAMLWHRATLWQSNARALDNDRRSLVLPVFLGRSAYNASEAFPATKRGESILTVTWDISASGFDGLRISIEVITLPGVSPEFVQRVLTTAVTFGATGQQDVDLPVGNVMRALLLFGTTGFAGASPAPSWGDIQVLLSDQQTHFTATRWEVLRSVVGLMGVPFPPGGRHIHDPNFDVVSPDAIDLATNNTLTNEIKNDLNALIAVLEPEVGASLDENYALLDFDPTRDDEYSINTEGASRFHVRADADTADAVRVLTVEKVPVARFIEGP